MTRLFKLDERVHPGLAQWLTSDFPRVSGRPQVWGAFCRSCQLTEAEAREVIAAGTDPLVTVEVLPGVSGQFNPGRPNVVALAKEIVEPFERAPDGANTHQVEATLLHELIHWSWARAQRREPPRDENADDIGDLFEREAYGALRTVEALAHLEVETRSEEDDLGSLSRAYESNGKPGAIGCDTNGGWSYGLYQLSSKQGTLARFIEFLGREGVRSPDCAAFATALRSAGGDAGARNGTQAFRTAWLELASKPLFSIAQHRFIKETHYDVYLAKLRAAGIELAQRPRAVRDVAWSVSVQHGPGRTSIFERPWAQLTPLGRTDDAQLITAVYHERSRVDVYFKRSSPRERAAVLARFADERTRALAMLRAA